MVLNNYRDQADVVLIPIAKRITRLSPNTITFISLILAIMSGIFFAVCDRSDDYLLPAFIFLFLSALFDALDGKVARLTNTASVQGDLLDHVIDRYSDIFILGGITFSPYCPVEIGFIAIISVLMLSYMGTQAQAVGGKRHYGGWLGRADRLMLILVVSVVQYLLMITTDTHELSEYYLLGWMMILFIFVGNLNAVQRLHDTWKDLEENGDPTVRGVNGSSPSRKRAALKMRSSDWDSDDDIEWKGK